MTEIAAGVPPTWEEATKQESVKARLDMLRNDTRRQQAELQETVSFHKQYHEAVVRAGESLKEIEEKLDDEASVISELEKGPLLEVSVIY